MMQASFGRKRIYLFCACLSKLFNICLPLIIELFVAESGTEIERLSARCQELDQECERLIADVNAHEKDVRGM